ncbi:hypothetical protein LTR85_008185 [Meristemomyces frigidus]|nr:hypothetical protein LTR85_008185 [Meristemomyces frigidus]
MAVDRQAAGPMGNVPQQLHTAEMLEYTPDGHRLFKTRPIPQPSGGILGFTTDDMRVLLRQGYKNVVHKGLAYYANRKDVTLWTAQAPLSEEEQAQIVWERQQAQIPQQRQQAQIVQQRQQAQEQLMAEAEGLVEDVSCVCRQPKAGKMVQCDVCNEWYHCKCIAFVPRQEGSSVGYICHGCEQSGMGSFRLGDQRQLASMRSTREVGVEGLSQRASEMQPFGRSSQAPSNVPGSGAEGLLRAGLGGVDSGMMGNTNVQRNWNSMPPPPRPSNQNVPSLPSSKPSTTQVGNPSGQDIDLRPFGKPSHASTSVSRGGAQGSLRANRGGTGAGMSSNANMQRQPKSMPPPPHPSIQKAAPRSTREVSNPSGQGIGLQSISKPSRASTSMSSGGAQRSLQAGVDAAGVGMLSNSSRQRNTTAPSLPSSKHMPQQHMPQAHMLSLATQPPVSMQAAQTSQVPTSTNDDLLLRSAWDHDHHTFHLDVFTMPPQPAEVIVFPREHMPLVIHLGYVEARDGPLLRLEDCPEGYSIWTGSKTFCDPELVAMKPHPAYNLDIGDAQVHGGTSSQADGSGTVVEQTSFERQQIGSSESLQSGGLSAADALQPSAQVPRNERPSGTPGGAVRTPSQQGHGTPMSMPASWVLRQARQHHVGQGNGQ